MHFTSWVSTGIATLVAGTLSIFSMVHPLPAPAPVVPPVTVHTQAPVSIPPSAIQETILNLFKAAAPASTTVPKLAATTTPTKAPVAAKPKAPAVVPPTPKTPPVSPALTATTTTSIKAVPTKPPAIAPAPVAAPTPTPAPVSTNKVTDAVVNIVCVSKDPSVHSVSGSGVFIDSRGLILTVAHVGQMFLLKDYPETGNIRCVIRTGSPAHNAYLASPVYISGTWIRKNPSTLIDKMPKGTGENDFAVLAVTGSYAGESLPHSFPAIPLAAEDPSLGDSVTIDAYPAQDLTTADIKNALFPTIVDSSVKKVYTFTDRTVDVISLGGSAAAQEGSSGGAIIDSNNHLVGLITTSSEAPSLAARDLRAITPGHIRRSFNEDMGGNFDTYLSGISLESLVANFIGRAATLTSILATALSK